MVSIFPYFHQLSIAHKDEVNQILKELPMYSDFNFASLYSWNTSSDTLISRLGDTLIIRQPNYLDGRLETHVYGQNPEEAIRALWFSSPKGNAITMHLVPKPTAMHIKNTTNCTVVKDRDNFDYILDVDEQIAMRGSRYADRRNHIRKFKKEYDGRYTVKLLNLADSRVIASMHELCKTWASQTKQAEDDTITEMRAIERLLESVDYFDLYCMGIYVDKRLVAFAINEVVSGDSEIGHFLKADYSIRRVFTFLVHACVSYAHVCARKFINIEQDLGLKPLRVAKMELRPSHFMEKYTITLHPVQRFIPTRSERKLYTPVYQLA